MVSEEISLAHVLEAARGFEVVETDLGEFIVQISKDRPSHLVAPIVHKDKASIAKLFSEYFETPYDDDPNSLTMQARAFLRDKFRKADLGMTGGNFHCAESGRVCSIENEGNQRQSVSTPRVLIALVGIEKVVPRMVDLAVMLKLLTRSATGSPISIYTNLYGGPRGFGEKDGPQEFHLVLVDNGRSEILGSKYRETLRCIRCGACLNACPIYRKIQGARLWECLSRADQPLITPLFKRPQRVQVDVAAGVEPVAARVTGSVSGQDQQSQIPDRNATGYRADAFEWPNRAIGVSHLGEDAAFAFHVLADRHDAEMGPPPPGARERVGKRILSEDRGRMDAVSATCPLRQSGHSTKCGRRVMAEATVAQAFAAAVQHHQAGRLAQAEQFYRAILANQPNHPDALHLLGVIANQGGAE